MLWFVFPCISAASKRNSGRRSLSKRGCARGSVFPERANLGLRLKYLPPTEAKTEQTLVTWCPALPGNPHACWKLEAANLFRIFTESEANPRWSEDGLKFIASKRHRWHQPVVQSYTILTNISLEPHNKSYILVPLPRMEFEFIPTMVILIQLQIA